MRGDKLAASADAFVKNFGPLASKAEYDGVVFLMVCTEPLKTGVPIPGYDPLQWLEQALKDAGDKSVVIFTHAPDVQDFYANQMHPGWPQAARDKWETLIKGRHVKAVITGHFHRDELSWIGNAPQFVCPPVVPVAGRQPAYRMYEYSDGKVGYRTIYVD